MLTDYYVQKVSLDCYPLMKELFLSAFNMKTDYSRFIKQYDTQKLGHSVIGFLAIHKISNEPAAYYGVFPLKALIDGKETLIALSGDTMTHKNHRKKGLFIHLAESTFDECRKNGIQLIVGLPNENSYHGLVNKLHWKHADDVIAYDLKLRIKTFPLPKICIKIHTVGSYIKYAKLILRKKTVYDLNSFCNPLDK
jgi:hypothetical protein